MRYRARKKSKKGLYIALVLLAALAAGGYYVYTSESFERQSPQIEIADEIYWNLKDPLEVRISDNSGIKSYKVAITDGQKSEMIDTQTLANPQKEVTVKVHPPVDMEFAKGRAQLIVEAKDKSFWNYFMGNEAKKRINIYIDAKKPDLFIVNNSYAITKGGSALVIFHCKDQNLKEFYIRTNFGKRFEAVPFYKEGYYATLIAWPLTKRTFRADVVAVDKAGNRAKAYIPLYLRNKRYKTSKINLKDSFLDGKIAELAEDDPKARSLDRIERFKYVNEVMRKKNEELIYSLAAKVPKEMISDFDIEPFKPLKNAAKVASFGDHRYYYYKGRLISDAYHLGLDLASTKMAPIVASNPGEVVFADYNGIYGNMPMIGHGLGLYTLYGHCSTIFVRKGDEVSRGETIAKTGRTGLALGDHLHFEVLVQGVPVRPEEWMDPKWIKLNVKDVMQEAKKLIQER